MNNQIVEVWEIQGVIKQVHQVHQQQVQMHARKLS